MSCVGTLPEEKNHKKIFRHHYFILNLSDFKNIRFVSTSITYFILTFGFFIVPGETSDKNQQHFEASELNRGLLPLYK